jgi:transposase
MAFIQQSRTAQPSLRTQELAQLVQERFGVQIHPRSIERKLSRRQKKRRGAT